MEGLFRGVLCFEGVEECLSLFREGSWGVFLKGLIGSILGRIDVIFCCLLNVFVVCLLWNLVKLDDFFRIVFGILLLMLLYFLVKGLEDIRGFMFDFCVLELLEGFEAFFDVEFLVLLFFFVLK